MKKIFLVLLLFFIFLVSCDYKTIKSVEVCENPEFNVGEFDISKLKLLITYTDQSTEVINVTYEFVEGEVDFSEVGMYELVVNYKKNKVVFLVNIVSNDGSFKVKVIDNEEVVFEETFTNPTIINSIAPLGLTHHTFVGWFINDDLFSFDNIITTNVIIKAKYAKNEYKVTFIVNDAVYLEETYFYNEEVKRPENPLDTGIYEFVDWDYDFSLKVTSNITINAILNLNYVSVTFVDNNEIIKHTINYNTTIQKPTEVKKSFLYWALDGKEFDFNTKITTNIVLVAVYQDIVRVYNYLKSSKNVLLYKDDLATYDIFPWSNYTLNRGDDVLFITNVIEIISNDVDLKQEVNTIAQGILYVNKLDVDFDVVLKDTHSRLNSTYVHVVSTSSNLVQVINTTNPDYVITIPANGFLFLPMANDGESSSGLTKSMRNIENNEIITITNWKEPITVTYKNNFGEILGSKDFLPGEDLTYPEIPIIEGYEFVKWSKDKVFYNTDVVAIYASSTQKEVEIEVINGTGGGVYSVGSEVILKSKNIENYKFSHWSEYGVNVSDEVVYITYASIDTTIVAIYEKVMVLKNLNIGGKDITYRNSSVNVTIPSTYIDKKVEFRAAWVSPITGCVSRFNNETQYKQNITEMLDVLEYFNMNAVMFHIRIYNDALYKSNLNPTSTYLDTNLDLLTWVIEETHKRGIEFHAWMNPYRVVSSGGSNLVTIANSIKAKQPNNIGSDVKYLLGNGSGVILNPAIPEVREFLYDTVMEVIENYDVDAIHFDDYFYIEGIDDSSDRIKYNTTSLSIGDFRRKQVDTFIKELFEKISDYNKKNNKYVQLGISPSGIYRNGNGIVTYTSNGNAITNGSNTSGFAHYDNYLYSDTLKWINEEWIDYIIPQTYWALNHPTASFADCLDWWDKVVKYKNVNLYAGLGIYMAESTTTYSWYNNPDELMMQLAYTTKLDTLDGVCLFKFQYLREYYKKTSSSIYTTMFNKLLSDNWNSLSLLPSVYRFKDLEVSEVTNLEITNLKEVVTIKFTSSNALNYAILRSDGGSSKVVGLVYGNGNLTYTDKVKYSSKYNYTVVAISYGSTLSKGVSQEILVKTK